MAADERLDTVPGGTSIPQEPDPRNVRVLKWTVIVLGVLLVAGTIALIAGISFQASKLPRAGTGFGDIDIPVPANHTVREVVVDGDRMAIRLTGQSGERIVVVDIKRGRVTGTVRLRPAE